MPIHGGVLGVGEAVAILAAAVTVAGGIAAGARLAWRAMRAMVRVGDAVPTLLVIAEQFTPNGGNSLHDQITAIRKEQISVAAALMKTGSLSDRVEALEQVATANAALLADLPQAPT